MKKYSCYKLILMIILILQKIISSPIDKSLEQGEEIEIKAIYNKKLDTIKYEGKFFINNEGSNNNKNEIGSILEMNTLKSKFEGNSKYNLENTKISLEEILASTESTNQSDIFIFNVSLIAFLTIFAGAMSGLTVGYLSIDDLVLELKSKTGTDTEQEYASKILPIISKRHWLLVTLLLCNATAMEALPIFLNRLVDEYFAIIISVTLVLFVGEIIPQALCTGPSQLKIASFLSPLTNFLMYITFPISYPISLVLDHLVGKHSKSRFVNTDLKGLIELHTLEALDKLSREQGGDALKTSEIGLHNEQADLMISALEISERKSMEIMIPLDNVFMIDCDQIMDNKNIEQIINKGFSRIPVYSIERNNVLGILRIKQLIGLDFCQRKSIKQMEIKLSQPIIVHPNSPTLELLHEFKKGKSHMAFITPNVEEYKRRCEAADPEFKNSQKSNYLGININKGKSPQNVRLLGMVTLEDVLEKMINIEILDEDDYARNKILHEKKNTKQKSEFYKKAITAELARSLLEDNRERLNSIIDHSYRARNILLEKDHYDYEYDPKSKLKEPLL